jgi:hypothetical protein
VVGPNAQKPQAVPSAGLVDAQGPSAEVRAPVEAEAELDSPLEAAAPAAVANDSSSVPAAVVELRVWLAPGEVAPVAARQAVQWSVQMAEPDSRTTRRSCNPVDARIASSRH